MKIKEVIMLIKLKINEIIFLSENFIYKRIVLVFILETKLILLYDYDMNKISGKTEKGKTEET
jgi:hypothetical protein